MSGIAGRHRRNLLNTNLPVGVYRDKTGHLRHSSPKELRGKLVHRAIVEKLIEETPYSIRQLLPWPYEVHHVDYNKENNDPSNFIICPEAFHSFMTMNTTHMKKKFRPKWKPAPEWKLFEEDIREVPF